METLRKQKFEREPQNVPGPFYVAKDQCIICMLPHQMAPELIGFHQPQPDSHADSHCYFKRQPVTAREFDLAIQCVDHACCAALRYCGNDKTIIERIRKGHNPDALD
jgi:hypothetical protein